MAERDKKATPRARRLVGALAALTLALALAACGGSAERQDVDEPEGDFPVEIVKAKFPTEQRLAQTSDFILEVKNSGDESLPDLAVTVSLDNGEADGSFSIRDPKPNLANPNRPVWILESKFPRLVGDDAPTGLSGSTVAQTNTFAFGEVEPGESREIVWRVTPVEAGTYTVNYIVSAGVFGKARAVTDGGNEASGEIVVTITDEPPKTKVGKNGEVIVVD